MNLKRLVGSTFLFAAIPLFANGCGAADDLCCSEFSAGADLSAVDFKVEGEAGAQYKVLAQSSADLAGAVNGAVDDVTTACRNIARDLGATEAEIKAEDIKKRDDAITGMCALATAKIEAGLSISGGAKAKLAIKFDAPKCEASFSAKANCQAQCSGSAECDVTVDPPRCEGGKVTLSCEGSCSGSVTAAIDCKGKCDVAASGSCTAEGGVDCAGKCEGTCEGSTDAGGNCQGMCKGSCSAVAPKANCQGSFEGKCEATCSASANAKVECSAGCSGSATPIKCEGGEVKGGCKVEAKCDANCDASVSAKASCTPPKLAITVEGGVSGDAQAKVGAVIDTLKVNLPAILVVWKARGDAFVKLVGNISASASGSVSGDLGVKGTACLIPIGEALVDSAGSIKATLSASISVGGAAGVAP